MGGMILLALRPGADPMRVAAKARGIIQQRIADRVGVWVPSSAAVQIHQTPAVVRTKVVGVVQMNVAPPPKSSSWLFPLLAFTVVGLALLWCWRKGYLAMPCRA
jgi:hypothetical protein